MTKTTVQMKASEMEAMIWAARIIYWQTTVAQYQEDNNELISFVASMGLTSAVDALKETGVSPKQLLDVADRFMDQLKGK